MVPAHRLFPLFSCSCAPFFCSPISPFSILHRLSSIDPISLPSHKQIMSRITPIPSPVSAMIKWDNSLPFPINWPLSISQRLSPFIPPRAGDVMLRIHCRTLQTASRLHTDLIPLECLNCKRPRSRSFTLEDVNPILSPMEGFTSFELYGESQFIHNIPAVAAPAFLCSEESLSHCLLTCPKITPIIESIKRVLLLHFSVSIDYASELLFALPSLPGDGFPISLLQALSFYHIWLARCEKRFNNRLLHPKAILQIILTAFVSGCEAHFLQLRHSRSRAKQKELREHAKIVTEYKIFHFSSSLIPFIHPKFKQHWLLCQNFHPP